MHLFHWLGAGDIPLACDLRSFNWRLVPAADHAPLALAHRPSMGMAGWRALLARTARYDRPRILLLGVHGSETRARLLNQGFGDVLGSRIGLAELEARASRFACRAEALPRSLTLGALRLDLLAREGFVEGRPLGFYPREFALLWRLAETPGRAVGKPALVDEVLRLRHVPDTNSLAVHVSRLRAKLAIAGLEGMVQTAPAGGYLLALA